VLEQSLGIVHLYHYALSWLSMISGLAPWPWRQRMRILISCAL
jgi:hypothetical protein